MTVGANGGQSRISKGQQGFAIFLVGLADSLLWVGPYEQYSGLYYPQLHCLKEAIVQKRPTSTRGWGILFHQYNATLYTSIVTLQKLQ